MPGKNHAKRSPPRRPIMGGLRLLTSRERGELLLRRQVAVQVTIDNAAADLRRLVGDANQQLRGQVSFQGSSNVQAHGPSNNPLSSQQLVAANTQQATADPQERPAELRWIERHLQTMTERQRGDWLALILQGYETITGRRPPENLVDDEEEEEEEDDDDDESDDESDEESEEKSDKRSNEGSNEGSSDEDQRQDNRHGGHGDAQREDDDRDGEQGEDDGNRSLGHGRGKTHGKGKGIQRTANAGSNTILHSGKHNDASTAGTSKKTSSIANGQRWVDANGRIHTGFVATDQPKKIIRVLPPTPPRITSRRPRSKTQKNTSSTNQDTQHPIKDVKKPSEPSRKLTSAEGTLAPQTSSKADHSLREPSTGAGRDLEDVQSPVRSDSVDSSESGPDSIPADVSPVQRPEKRKIAKDTGTDNVEGGSILLTVEETMLITV